MCDKTLLFMVRTIEKFPLCVNEKEVLWDIFTYLVSISDNILSQSCPKSILPILAGRRHILFTPFPSPSMAPVTADFGPSSVLIQGQNAPLREHPVPLPADGESILDKTEVK